MTFDDSIGATGVFRNAKIFRLGTELAVLIWDLPPALPANTRCLLSMEQSPVPLVSMMLPLGNGGQRMFWAMRPEKRAVNVGYLHGARQHHRNRRDAAGTRALQPSMWRPCSPILRLKPASSSSATC